MSPRNASNVLRRAARAGVVAARGAWIVVKTVAVVWGVALGATLIVAVGGAVVARNSPAERAIACANSTRTQICVLETAALAYEIRHGRLPDSLEELMAQRESSSKNITDCFSSKTLADSYGNPFAYKKNENSFEIRSAGLDGIMHNEDDIINTRNN